MAIKETFLPPAAELQSRKIRQILSKSHRIVAESVCLSRSQLGPTLRSIRLSKTSHKHSSAGLEARVLCCVSSGSVSRRQGLAQTHDSLQHSTEYFTITSCHFTFQRDESKQNKNFFLPLLLKTQNCLWRELEIFVSLIFHFTTCCVCVTPVWSLFEYLSVFTIMFFSIHPPSLAFPLISLKEYEKQKEAKKRREEKSLNLASDLSCQGD